MNKEELHSKAREYAVSVLDAKINEIAEAYIKGYEDGVKSVPVEKTVIDVDGVKYYDFGLPSGLLWSAPLKDGEDCLRFPYREAAKYRLPTRSEFEELFYNCKIQCRSILGRNGYRLNDEICSCWMVNDPNTSAKSFMAFDYRGIIYERFEGDSYGLMLVKPKDEIK